MMKRAKCLFFIFFCIFFMTACQKKEPVELKPFENIKIKETGWNGSGKIEVTSHKIHYTGNDESIKKLIHSLQYTAKNNKELKNGDKVTVKLVYDSDLFKLANVKFNKTEYTYKVHSLQDDTRTVKTITNEKKDPVTGKNVDVAEQIITVDGIEIPASWNLSDEEIQEYVSYMKGAENSENVPEEKGVDVIWSQGESDVKTNRKNSKYYTKDYNNNDVECYQAAYSYGQTSSQQFKIKPVFQDDKSIGYECIFKENS